MTDRYNGDPSLFITKNGATLDYQGGNPVMDQGLENFAQIALLTTDFWADTIEPDPEKKIASDYEETASQAITVSSLAAIEKSAVKALSSSLFNDVESTVTNPESSRINNEILLTPTGQDTQSFYFTRSGELWIKQARDPAHSK